MHIFFLETVSIYLGRQSN